MKLKANLYYFALASRAANPDQEYPVLIEPRKDGKGVRVVATDGHHLMIFRDLDGFVEKPIVLNSGFLTGHAKIYNQENATLTSDDDKLLTLKGGKHTSLVSLAGFTASGQFPNYRNLSPLKNPDKLKPRIVHTDFNIGLMSNFSFKGRQNLTLWQEDSHPDCLEPIVVLNYAIEDFVGLIMPLSPTDTPPKPTEHWAFDKPTPEEKDEEKKEEDAA